MARILFKTGLLRVLPPWLQRAIGKKLVDSISEQIDDLDNRLVDGVKLRLPADAPDPTALGMIGRERRIRRGPAESPITYARRLRRWLDDHKGRGGPYALLYQLDGFWQDSLNVRMDVVYQSGTRRWISAATTVEESVITRDSVVWGGDGTGKWARFWVFFHLTGGLENVLITEDGDTLITEDGDVIVAELLTGGSVTDEDAEMFRIIPREWSAAHIDQIVVALLYGLARLWNYPQPVPTWAAWGASGATWGGPVPVLLQITE